MSEVLQMMCCIGNPKARGLVDSPVTTEWEANMDPLLLKLSVFFVSAQTCGVQVVRYPNFFLGNGSR